MNDEFMMKKELPSDPKKYTTPENENSRPIHTQTIVLRGEP